MWSRTNVAVGVVINSGIIFASSFAQHPWGLYPKTICGPRWQLMLMAPAFLGIYLRSPTNHT